MVRCRWRSLALALALLSTVASPALANDPGGERPLTPQEVWEGERKIREAERYLAGVDAGSAPQDVCPMSTQTGAGPQHACPVPEGFIAVEARDQVKSTYCGPAVGQVVANYVWAMGAGQNKFTQAQIAVWMKTDVNGGTSAPNLAAGLNTVTNGSPRKPANWVWVVVDLRDRNGNGMVGDDLHGYIRSNISGARMPLAYPVKPHEPGAEYRLASWPKPVPSVGHWIAGYGWRYMYQGNDKALAWYTDSSKDEGGATGKFVDPVRHLTILIMAHTKRLVW